MGKWFSRLTNDIINISSALTTAVIFCSFIGLKIVNCDIIVKDTEWVDQDITCAPADTTCTVTCAYTGDDFNPSCGVNGATGTGAVITCPETTSCTECTINCNAKRSCKGTTIYGNGCNLLNINFIDNENDNMVIYASDNNGSLFINLTTSNGKMQDSEIYGNTDTNNIMIDCSGGEFKANTVNASNIEGILSYKSSGLCKSQDSVFYCPTENICTLEFSGAKDDNTNKDIEITGTHLLDFTCPAETCEAILTCLDSTVNCNECTSGYSCCYGNCVPPTSNPTFMPSTLPSVSPSSHPTIVPTLHPTFQPTIAPTSTTVNPTFGPTKDPSNHPSHTPSTHPTLFPSFQPSTIPTLHPSIHPAVDPTTNPTYFPIFDPSYNPSYHPTIHPTNNPTFIPTFVPSISPTIQPTHFPSIFPINNPTLHPTNNPSGNSGEFSNSGNKASLTTIIIAVVSLSIFFFIVFMIVAYFYRKNKKHKEYKIRIEAKLARLESNINVFQNVITPNGNKNKNVNVVEVMEVKLQENDNEREILNGRKSTEGEIEVHEIFSEEGNDVHQEINTTHCTPKN